MSATPTFQLCWKCSRPLDTGVMYYTSDISTPCCWTCALNICFCLKPITPPSDNPYGNNESE